MTKFPKGMKISEIIIIIFFSNDSTNIYAPEVITKINKEPWSKFLVFNGIVSNSKGIDFYLQTLTININRSCSNERDSGNNLELLDFTIVLRFVWN